jgi:hemerythrin-like domain-containing protein
MSDLIRKLEHDHDESLRHLTRLLRELLAQAEDERRGLGEIHADFLEALDEMCLEVDHFAMEETSLFPAILGALPALAPLVDEVQRSHRALDGLVARVAATLQPGPTALRDALPELTELVQRFLAEFTHHAERENELLQRAQHGLSPAQKAALLADADDRR